MKIVINNDYGGFGLDVSEKGKQLIKLANKLGEERTNQVLVEFVENNPDECGDLVVVTIPDKATDWTIWECDGLEEVIYVLDGKLHYAEQEDNDDEDCDEDWD